MWRRYFFWKLLSRSPTVHEQQVHFTILSYVLYSISSYFLWFKFSAFLYELIWLRNEGDKMQVIFGKLFNLLFKIIFVFSNLFFTRKIRFLTIQSMFCFIQHSWMIIKLGVSIAKAPITQTCRVYHMASCWSLQPMLCFIISWLIDPVRVFNNLFAIYIQQWRKRLSSCFYGEHF